MELAPTTDAPNLVGPAPLFGGKRKISALGLCIAERIDTKGLGAEPGTAAILRVGETGCAVAFRYGCLVLFDVDAAQRARFLNQIAARLVEPLAVVHEDDLKIEFDADTAERVVDGIAILKNADAVRLQLVASNLAKSVLLAYYEASLAEAFAQVEPLAASLYRKGKTARRSRDLIRQIGAALLVEHRMVGRAEVAEKPELLWDRPDLEAFHARLQEEYEIKERYAVLENKLGLLSRTVGTVLDLIQDKRTLRVEWYIVALIVVELALSIYNMLRGSGPP